MEKAKPTQQKKSKLTKSQIIGAIIGVIGFVLVAHQSLILAVGVYAMILGNNIERSQNLHDHIETVVLKYLIKLL